MLSFSLLTGAAHATQQDDLDRLRKRLSALQQQFEKTSESKAEAADELRLSERAISDSNRKLHHLNQRLQLASRELGQVELRAAAMQKELQGQQAMLGRLLYQQYVNRSEQEYLRLLLNNENPSEAARELHYYSYLARQRGAALKSLRDNLASLQAVSDQARRKHDEVAALQAEERSEREQLETDKRSRQTMLRKIALQLQQQRREIGRLQRNESRLSQLLGQLADVLPERRGDSVPFSSLKGRLVLPVKGQLRNRFGGRRPEGAMTWTGWFLSAAPNQPVRAVAAGRVVYADWLRGFGNLLVIDHGEGYMSLYGNNETLYKQAGDVARTGDTIAAVGSSGGNADSGLYFELRFEGNPLDPKGWVKR